MGINSENHEQNLEAASEPAGLQVDQVGAAVLLTLARAQKMNAIDSALRMALSMALNRYARDPEIYALVLRSAAPQVFSVGGDVRELYGLAGGPSGESRATAWVAAECALIWQLDCFPKPTISLIDGIVMGTGSGLAMVGTHQVAGEDYLFQMPETAIGYFPDVGMAQVFSRLPHEVGIYLALTGRMIDRADAYRLGLVSHCVETRRFAEIEAELADAHPVDPVLDSRHEHPGPAPIDAVVDVIDRCFSAPTVAGIVDRLGASDQQPAWCAEVREELLARSPLALEVALRHIREARDLDLRQTLIVDHRIGSRLARSHDFSAGVRGTLIERTGVPTWQPERLQDVTLALVDRIMAPFPADAALVLPTRQEMQARVVPR